MKIEVRVWDGKEMHYNVKMVQLSDYCESINEIFKDEKLIFMLSTLRRDINKKKIYESDIVRVYNPSGLEVEGVYEVIWDEDEARFYLKDFPGYVDVEELWLNSEHRLEVIGNIYENPQLLNEKGRKKCG